MLFLAVVMDFVLLAEIKVYSWNHLSQLIIAHLLVHMHQKKKTAAKIASVNRPVERCIYQ
jgi:hypothetical protein